MYIIIYITILLLLWMGVRVIQPLSKVCNTFFLPIYKKKSYELDS